MRLAIKNTYQTDMRLARHYFFTADLSGFDALWAQILNRYEIMDYQLADYNELGQVYNLLRPSIQSTGSVRELGEAVLASLDPWANECTEPGYLVRSVLRRNGIIIEPDCSANVENRSADRAGERATSDAPPLGIFPNPANETVTVRLGSIMEKAGQIGFYDVQGRLVYQTGIEPGDREVKVNTSNIPEGFYYVKATSGKTTLQYGKLSINH